MGTASLWVSVVAGVAFAIAGVSAGATQIMPPVRSNDEPRRPSEPSRSGVATPTEPGAPALTRVPDASLSNLFRVEPGYQRAASARTKVVGAFEVAEPTGTRLTGAWAVGFLPVLLTFSDGRCFTLSADYQDGTLSNGRLKRANCDHRALAERIAVVPPSVLSLRLIGVSWSYAAWANDRAGTAIITAPRSATFKPLFTTHMAVVAIAAMNGPDWNGGNVTLVGRIRGRLTIVTLEVNY